MTCALCQKHMPGLINSETRARSYKLRVVDDSPVWEVVVLAARSIITIDVKGIVLTMFPL